MCRKDAPWLAEWLDELLAFPNGRHDDQVDSTSQALYALSGRMFPLHAPRSRSAPARAVASARLPVAPALSGFFAVSATCHDSGRPIRTQRDRFELSCEMVGLSARC